MSEKSKIQWTDATWNIARGCEKVDSDCKFCYMYRESLDGTRYSPRDVVRTKTVFNLPLKLKDPSKVFTCSLTDFFLPQIDSYRNEAWDIIRKCPQHTFQILTKRPDRIMQCLPEDWGDGWDNVWIGTSIGSNDSIHRLWDLLKVKCKTRFLSLEPMHGSILLPSKWMREGIEYYFQEEIHWVIIGGESGNDNGKYRYRPCELRWIEHIIAFCRHYNVPTFVKQLGTHLSKELGMKDRHGGNMDEWPSHLQVRQFPNYL